jgi:hypothetical protein
VLFDPAIISLDDMIAVLKKAGTFGGVAREVETVPRQASQSPHRRE